MRAAVDLSGSVVGRLRVLQRVGTAPSGQPLWSCSCSCGTMHTVASSELKSGSTRSCGCLRRETAIRTNTEHGHAGKRRSPEYRCWIMMRVRCMNRRNRAWRWYGGRGITICKRWESFANFLADMGRRPPGFSLDRIDNSGNYEPSNCRWATATEQANNRRPRAVVQP